MVAGGDTYQTAQMVQQCEQCPKEVHYRREPMIKPDLPDYPWQIIGTDLFELKGHQYLLTVDCAEVDKLTATSYIQCCQCHLQVEECVCPA